MFFIGVFLNTIKFVAKFCSNFGWLLQKEQLESHEQQLGKLESTIMDHKKGPIPTKGLALQNYKEKESFLQYEVRFVIKHIILKFLLKIKLYSLNTFKKPCAFIVAVTSL